MPSKNIESSQFGFVKPCCVQRTHNFQSTQASKIWVFSAFRITASFQTRHNALNSALAAPRRLLSSSQIRPLSHKKLLWNAGGGKRGRSFNLWDAPVTKFWRWHNIGKWQGAAQDKAPWLQYLPDSVIYAKVIYLLGLTPCALNGLPHYSIREQCQNGTCLEIAQ